MALREIRVPHLDTYAFGVGVDRLSGMAMNLVVTPAPSPPQQAGGANQTFQVLRITSTHDLQQSLGIDVNASYGCASFGAGVSARFSFAESSEVHSSSLFLAVTATVHLADLSIAECVLTPNAAAVAGNPAVFGARYGDVFARACRRGGLFVGVMHVETYDERQSTAIESELRGSYGLFSADAAASFSKITTDHQASVYCRVYTEGGPALQLADPNDPMQLLAAVNTWLRAMQDDPARFAVPYEWTLSPVSIAEGPLPPNQADIEHAQDVLQFCARERTGLLDQLNQVSWWLRHADHYDWSGPTGQAAATGAAAALQRDLDTVGACASAAMNDPAKAVFPADFATAQGGRYPSAEMPAPPATVLGKLVPVPPWNTEDEVLHGGVHLVPDAGGGTRQEYCPSAAEAGLEITIVRVASPYQEDSGGVVVTTSPPAGRSVPAGSAVQVMISLPA